MRAARGWGEEGTARRKTSGARGADGVGEDARAGQSNERTNQRVRGGSVKMSGLSVYIFMSQCKYFASLNREQTKRVRGGGVWDQARAGTPGAKHVFGACGTKRCVLHVEFGVCQVGDRRGWCRNLTVRSHLALHDACERKEWGGRGERGSVWG